MKMNRIGLVIVSAICSTALLCQLHFEYNISSIQCSKMRATQKKTRYKGKMGMPAK